jgi:hypothetical protein
MTSAIRPCSDGEIQVDRVPRRGRPGRNRLQVETLADLEKRGAICGHDFDDQLQQAAPEVG